MIHFFFNLEGKFESVADKIFKSIGISKLHRVDSFNVLGDYYFSLSVFGVLIKVERNSYDFDDQYKYMLTVRKDMTLHLKGIDDQIINNVAISIKRLLLHNIDDLDLALENSNGELEKFQTN